MSDNVLKKNIVTAYIIGMPLGIITIIIALLLPSMVSGEGLATLLLIENYSWAIIGLLTSFVVALNIASKKLHFSLLNGSSLLYSSFKFSLLINTIIWLVFSILTIAKNLEYNFLFALILPMLGFLVSLFGTTFTIGFLLSFLFKRNIKQQINTAGNLA